MLAIGKPLELLLSDSSDLYSLAIESELDAFSFYEGADLNGADLRDQDLRGLSFLRADLRNVKAEGSFFDDGALNGSLLNNELVGLQDTYDCSLKSFVDFVKEISYMYYWMSFRVSTLEWAIAKTGLPYNRFARSANINQMTLRRARRGLNVTFDTAQRIVNTIFASLSNSNIDYHHLSWFRQPSMIILNFDGSQISFDYLVSHYRVSFGSSHK